MSKSASTTTPAWDIKYIPYKIPIRYIYHISDIHIHLYKRHDEYQQVFDSLLEYLRAEKKRLKIKPVSKTDIPVIVLITGDVLHSKSDLSPECIAFAYKFFKDILDIMPLVVIPGNHDLNMNNKDRLDSLTAIICDLPQHAAMYHLNDTGVTVLGNLVLSHASIFDYYIIPPAELRARLEPNKITKDCGSITNIALYHGRVNGCELFNGSRIDGEVNTITKKTITPSNFEGYDMALLGDIHKWQYIDESRTRAYAGSLIQQNLGEDIDGHGILVWDVNARTCNHVPIKNDYGYVTFHLADGTCTDDLSTLKNTYPPNIRARILYENTSPTQLDEFIAEVKRLFTLLEYSCQNDEAVIKSSTEGFSHADGEVDQSQKREVNINDVNYQNRLLEEIIRETNPNLPDSDIEAIKLLNTEANKLYRDTEATEDDAPAPTPVRGFRYKLRRLEFDNLFSYGPGNVIDFTQCKGVVGIVAPNHMGKSSILDIILYALFDKFTRKGTVKDMINNRKSGFRVRLELDSGVWRYTIEKSGEKTATGIGKSKCLFTRRHMVSGRVENLQKDNATGTKAYIAELFGNFDDMLNTNFSIQNNSTGFIDASNSARRSELERILKFDFINDLVKNANEAFRKNKTIFEHYQKNMPVEMVKETIDKIAEDEDRLADLVGKHAGYLAVATQLQADINNLNKQINPDVDARIAELVDSVDLDADSLLTGGENSDQVIETQITNLNTELATAENHSRELTVAILQAISGLEIEVKIEGPGPDKAVRDQLRADLQKVRAGIDQELVGAKQALTVLNKDIAKQQKLIKPYKATVVSQPVNPETLTARLDGAKTEKAALTEKSEALKKKEKALGDWEAKVETYNQRIQAAQVDIESLLATESVPTVLSDQYSADEVARLETECQASETTMWATKSQSKQHDLYTGTVRPLVEQLGWLHGIGKMIESSQATINKIEKKRLVIKETNDKITEAKQRITKLQAELKTVRQLDREIDTNAQLISNLESDLVAYESNLGVQTEITRLEAERNRLQTEITDNSRSSQVNAAASKLVEYESNLVTIRDIKQKIKALNTMHTELDSLMAAANANIHLQTQITAAMDKLAANDRLLVQLTGQMERLKDQISAKKGLLDKLKKDCVDKIEKQRLMEINAVYRDALKQIPIILINKVQHILVRKVNDLLSVVTNFTVRFDMSDNMIDIYLDRPVYNGRSVLINNSSGFERFISSLAIRIALMEISQLPNPNFMAIDEGWGCFDNENIANMDIILDYLGQRFDFLLTISHLQVIRQHCDIQITLRKDQDGFSCVTYG
jgi:DNA repair exonuclease SbcCD ATPase subunit/DNA repair exonuclease SbcCD nuclease subunit